MGTFYICAMDPCGPLCRRLGETREMHNRKSQNYRFRRRRFKRIRSTSAPFGKNASRSLSSDRPVASCRTKNFFHLRGCCCWEFQVCRMGPCFVMTKSAGHCTGHPAAGSTLKDVGTSPTLPGTHSSTQATFLTANTGTSDLRATSA